MMFSSWSALVIYLEGIFALSLDNTRDAIDKREIEVKEVKDKLSSLTASAEKSVQG